jgi:hypothetical protein
VPNHDDHHLHRFAVLLLLTLLTGCNAPRTPAVGNDDWVRTELFFGLAKPGGATVTETEWNSFLERSVTPRFPEGFTVAVARGHYRGSDHTAYDEPSRVLVVFHPRADSAANARIDEIARDYARTFHQESVLRTDSAARVTLLDRQPLRAR